MEMVGDHEAELSPVAAPAKRSIGVSAAVKVTVASTGAVGVRETLAGVTSPVAYVTLSASITGESSTLFVPSKLLLSADACQSAGSTFRSSVIVTKPSEPLTIGLPPKVVEPRSALSGALIESSPVVTVKVTVVGASGSVPSCACPARAGCPTCVPAKAAVGANMMPPTARDAIITAIDNRRNPPYCATGTFRPESEGGNPPS